jgi:hypothetical protein
MEKAQSSMANARRLAGIAVAMTVTRYAGAEGAQIADCAKQSCSDNVSNHLRGRSAARRTTGR